MPKKELFVIATKQSTPDGKVVPGKVFERPCRAVEHAVHELPRIAKMHSIPVASLGIFQGKELIETKH